MALGTCSVGAVRRKVRATGSTLQPQSEFRMGNGRTGRTRKAGQKGTHFLNSFWDG